MAEAIAVERWIEATLTGDATLAALVTAADGTVCMWPDEIPAEVSDDVAYPAVLWSCVQDGDIIYSQPQHEQMAKFKYRVWAVNKGTPGSRPDKLALEAIRDRIQHLMQGKTGTNVSGYVIFVSRLSSFSPPLWTNPQTAAQYARLGDTYAIWAQPA